MSCMLVSQENMAGYSFMWRCCEPPSLCIEGLTESPEPVESTCKAVSLKTESRSDLAPAVCQRLLERRRSRL